MPQHSDVIIVGGGLFGTIIGDWLTLMGHEVTVYDAERPHSGSRPAACLMKPSWLTGLNKEQREHSFSVLDRLYGVQELRASVVGIPSSVFWVPPAKILRPGRYTKAKILGVDSTGVHYFHEEADCAVKYTASTVIIAAGVWAWEFDASVAVFPQAGAAFTWTLPTTVAAQYSEPSIRPWAPYKQLVSMRLDDNTVWVGDGTAVKPESFTPERWAKCEERCTRHVGLEKGHAQRWYGLRPYMRGLTEPCYLKPSQLSPNVWIVTGGGKNGTAAAGWAAFELAERLK